MSNLPDARIIGILIFQCWTAVHHTSERAHQQSQDLTKCKPSFPCILLGISRLGGSKDLRHVQGEELRV